MIEVIFKIVVMSLFIPFLLILEAYNVRLKHL